MKKWGRRVESDVNKPKVSIGLPTFNGGRQLIRAISSVINQDYENIEIIISDNCSTDDTEEVCVSLSQRYPCITYYRQPVNRGVTANYSFVIDKATGDYFMWLSDDDTLEAGILKRYIDFLVANPDFSLVSGQVKYWQTNKVVLIEKDFTLDHSSSYVRVLSYYFKVMHGAMFYGLMPRQLVQATPLRGRIGDDWHFVASIAFAGKIKNLDVPGYNKEFGGLSTNMKSYARAIGASWFTANFPHFTIAVDAISEVLYLSPQYSRTNVVMRAMLAMASCVSVLCSHYFKVFPFIVGGKIKRWIRRPYQQCQAWLVPVQKN
jgi:glycosyltransferase involved in cell wall biosynthesis